MDLVNVKSKLSQVLRIRRMRGVENEHSTKKRAKEAFEIIKASGLAGVLHTELAELMGISPNALYPAVEPLLSDELVVIRGERGRYYVDTGSVNPISLLLQVWLAYMALPYVGLPLMWQRLLFSGYVFLLLMLLWESSGVTKGLQSQ